MTDPALLRCSVTAISTLITAFPGPFLPSYQTSTLQELILINLYKEWYKTHSHLKTTDSKEFYFVLTLREYGIPKNVIDENFLIIYLYANMWIG